MEEIRDFLSLLSELLLIIALPIVIAAAIQHLRVMTGKLKAKIGAEEWDAVVSTVKTAVLAAQQAGLLDGLIGEEKRQKVIDVAQDFLDERGVSVDVDKLATLVEAEVLTQLHEPSVPADSPQARQILIDKAVESAVLAAEQSGLKGLIQNVSTEKKAYAANMAKQYLQEHGMAIKEELLDGLIEAELLRLFLAARGELPSTGSPVG